MAGFKFSGKNSPNSLIILTLTKGRLVTEETRKKLSEARKTYVVSEETRRKLSESHKGQTAWNKGKSPSEETREKMRLARLNYVAKIKNL